MSTRVPIDFEKKKSGKKSKGILPPFLISKWFRIIREIIKFMLYIDKLNKEKYITHHLKIFEAYSGVGSNGTFFVLKPM